MGVFLFDTIAILLFWKFADRRRLKEFLPVIITGIFLRFLDHYIIIDWLKIWKVYGSTMSARLWIPMSANMTVWPCANYLFLQYMPQKHRWLYGLCWVATMISYLQCLKWLHVFTMGNVWNNWHTFGMLTIYFAQVYWTWYWVTGQKRQSKQDHLQGSGA